MTATIVELQRKLDDLRMLETAAANLKATRIVSEGREAAASQQFVVLDGDGFQAYSAMDFCGE